MQMAPEEDVFLSHDLLLVLKLLYEEHMNPTKLPPEARHNGKQKAQLNEEIKT